MVDMIPSIDLGLYIKGSTRDRRNVVDGVSQVMGETGFFFVTSHGLPTDLIEKTRRTALDFFNKPLTEKLLSSHPSGSLNRGYTPYAGESNANSSGRGTVAYGGSRNKLTKYRSKGSAFGKRATFNSIYDSKWKVNFARIRNQH